MCSKNAGIYIRHHVGTHIYDIRHTHASLALFNPVQYMLNKLDSDMSRFTIIGVYITQNQGQVRHFILCIGLLCVSACICSMFMYTISVYIL